MTEHLFRHGDLVIRKIKPSDVGELTEGSDLVLAGRDSAPHTLRGLCQFRVDGEGAAAVTTLLLAAPADLEHAGRHVAKSLDAGAYRIAALVEGDARTSVED